LNFTGLKTPLVIKMFDYDFLENLGFDIDFVEKNLPDKYKKGLTEEEQSIAKREAKETMTRAKDSSVNSKDLYKDWESDKRYRKRNPKMPKSKATEAFESRFDEGSSEQALKEKAKKSGISYGILKEVFDRGMAAWRSGHRPGVAPQQWALGRVNSFITGVGKARQADSDLWKKHKKSRKS
jgi:hypothetical protein